MVKVRSATLRVVLFALVFSCVIVLPVSRVGVAARRATDSVGQQDPPASFRGGVDFVGVDVTVTDQQGRPVPDLGLADFEVYEDGRRQKVSSFALVQIPIISGAPPAKPGGGNERVEPDVRSNERDAGGRVYVLLLDDLHVSALRSGVVKTAARQFVERHLGPHDVAAVLHTSGRADASQEFTTNPRLLLGAIDKFAGRKLRSAVLEKLDVYTQRNPDEATRADMRMERIEDPLSVARADQARSMLATLTGLGDMLSGSSGQRKAVVLFSEGLDYELAMSAAQTRSGLTTQTNTEAPTLRRELEEVIRASARANVSVYAVDPRGLAATGEDLIEVTSLPQNPLLGLTTTAFVDEVKAAQDSLRALSEETGGIAAVSSNDFGGAFDRLVADNSMYYLLGYNSSDPKQDGRFRKIEVRVNRPGLRVRARSGYTAAPTKRIESRILTEALEPSPILREALNGPLPVAGLPLRVFATPFRGERGATVLVGVEIDARQFKFEQKDGLFVDTLEVAIVALDDRVKFKAGDRHRIDLRLKATTHTAVVTEGLRLLFRLSLPPGRFQVRAAANEAGSGAVGSVFSDLEVPNFDSGQLSLSGLVLTTSRASALPTARHEPALAKVLPSPPTTSRTFRSGETVTAFFEVYGPAISRSDVDVVTTVRGADGRTRFRSDAKRSGGSSSGDVRGVTVPVFLSEVPAGMYTLTVEARQRSAPAVAAIREIPFGISGPNGR
jgi:VWFA-related protein